MIKIGRLNCLLPLALLATAIMLSAQQTPASSASELIRTTIDHECAASNQRARFMFLDRKEDDHGSSTKLAVETTQATASLLVALNGKPLSEEQLQAERLRLLGMLDHPEEIRKKQKAEREDDERTMRMVRALPDAFLYEPDGTQAGEVGLGKPGVELLRMKFRPNPAYRPPTRVEQVLAGMAGVVLVDAADHRIAQIDGTLIKDVSFGWGIFGHLDKGGHFLVEQAEEADGAWEMSRMSLDFTGKVMLLKGLRIKLNEVFSDFRPVPPDLTFKQGVKMLEEHVSNAGSRPGNGQ